MHSPLTILYRDDDLVAVHKPAGLLVHRSSIDTRASHFLLQTLRDQIGAAVHPVHRLDKATSGIVVFALHAQAASRLAEAFRDGAVAKTYVAVVRGWAPGAVDVDHPLRDIADRRARRRTLDTREAFTAVRCLARAEFNSPVGRYATARYSLVTCRPRTGRRHQIRRHMKHLRHPIIGDVNYGDGAHNRFFREALGITRLLLAASVLRLPHPRTGETIELHAPVDASFLDALAGPEWQALAADVSSQAVLV
ncbi:MAG: pseudouridine synthase [Candidatus Binatia bacterium]